MTYRQSANTKLTAVNNNINRIVTRRMKLDLGISRLTLGEIGNHVPVATIDTIKNQLIKNEISEPANKNITRARAAKTKNPSSIALKSTNVNASIIQVSNTKAHSKVATAEANLASTKVELVSCSNLKSISSQSTEGNVNFDTLSHNISPMDISGDGTGSLSKAFTARIEDIDAKGMVNPQLVSIYVNSIYSYLRQLEKKYSVKPNFLDGTDITGKMRAILIDWLCQVHNKFHLLQETFYMTVSIIDRYLQVKPCIKTRLQLVGVTAMLIACKYEEMCAPQVRDFVYITDNAYTRQDILDMEHDILYVLDFSIGRPHCLHFLRRNSKAGEVSATEHMLAKYLMELTCVEYNMAHLQPSYVAAAAMRLSLLVLGQSKWSPTLEFYGAYTADELQPLVNSLAKLAINAQTSKFTAVRIKHSSSKCMMIARIPELKSKTLIDLAVKAHT